MFKAGVILLLAISIVSSEVILSGFNLTFASGQLTPHGYHHPLFAPVTSILLIESDQIPVEAYKGAILLAVGAGTGYHDDIIFRHMSYGCAGSIIMGTAMLYPGDSVDKMRNAESFAYQDENGQEQIYPVVGITIPVFGDVFKVLNESFFIQGIPVIATITSEEGDNVWKQRGIYPLFLAMIIMNGILNLFFIVWNCKTIQLLVKGDLFHTNKVTSTSTIINLAHNVTRIIGLVNFNAIHQLYDFVSAAIISSFNVPLIYIACWIHALIMYQIVTDNSLAVKSFLGKRVVWPFIAACCLLFVNDNVIAGIYGLPYDDPYAPLYLAIVRISVTCGLAAILGVVYVVGSILILRALKANPVGKKRHRVLIRKTTIMMFIMSGCFFGYCLSTGLVFLLFEEPFVILRSYFFYNLVLTVISACLCFSNYSAVRGRLYKSSSGDVKVDSISKSTEMTGTTGPVSPRSSV